MTPATSLSGSLPVSNAVRVSFVPTWWRVWCYWSVPPAHRCRMS